jgi:hypothetical protein
MMKPHFFLLLLSLLVDGGTVAPQPSPPGPDAGVVAPQPSPQGPDAGVVAPPPIIAEGIRWPDEVRPLATLDGPAVLAAHAVLQRVLARIPKEYAGDCAYSAKALEVVVGQEGGLYFVEVNRRVDKCGWAVPGTRLDLDWFELYAVSPDGRILARYPYHP